MLTLIDFYADWCGPCQVMKPTVEKVLKEFEGKVELQKVNVDENQQRAGEFGIMSIPTLVILKDGKEVDRRIGMLDETSLRVWLTEKL